jgi:hypothetical protein
MRRSIGPVLFSLAAALVLSGARAATAQEMGILNWTTPSKVQDAMEKDRVAGVFYFAIPSQIQEVSISAAFTNPTLIEIVKKNKLQCCKIPVSDDKSPRPWGSFQKLADEFGVGVATTLVVVSFDRMVLGSVSQVVRRDDLMAYLKKMAVANAARVKATDEANADLSQIEKWIDEKKFGDATRRTKMVLDKGDKVSKKAQDRAKEVDGKLETIGKERLEEGKGLLDAGKIEEAKAILVDVEKSFARFESGKEAKELVKKAEKLEKEKGDKKAS